MNKNTKWIALGFLVSFIFFGISTLIVVFAMNLLKGDAYQLSLTSLHNNSAVIEKMGEPIQPGWFVIGSISTSGSEGSASLGYSISGSLASGWVHVDAKKLEGDWKLNEVVVSINPNGEKLQVVEMNNEKY